ncbi:hypothetical protein D1007_05751 [Hordeum vulgare]|nr:hypothetical protein D1007_05751 [Hordeum vulgare]
MRRLGAMGDIMALRFPVCLDPRVEDVVELDVYKERHGQCDCKLPEDLHEMRYTAIMHASPYKKSNSRRGYVAPVANSARHLLSFGKEVTGERSFDPAKEVQERILEEFLANPLVQAAIAAVSALKVSVEDHPPKTQASQEASTPTHADGSALDIGVGHPDDARDAHACS